ncbi:MAG: hypothetical protein CL905_01225 [Dehalococcoidia bacterium]|nr:hypothetical protein [Dehalococcoidia bacterium]
MKKLVDEQANVGEGPLWDPNTQLLYWTDIRSGRLFKFDPSDNSNKTIHSGIFIGGFSVNSQGGLLLGTWRGVMLWESDEKYKWIHYGEFEGETLQFNDCIAGPDGSFYAGTFFDSSIEGKEKLGKLYRFFPDGKIEIVSENHGCSNGMGFSPDLNWFYHTDAAKKTIYRHHYDKKSHEVGESEVWFRYEKEGGTDGMTVDSEGFVWSAIWGGSRIIRIDPSGKIEREILVPAVQTSSLMFGGKELKDIYITTAASPQSKHDYEPDSYLGGSLFLEQQSIKGKLEFESNFSWE